MNDRMTPSRREREARTLRITAGRLMFSVAPRLEAAGESEAAQHLKAAHDAICRAFFALERD